MKAYGIYPMLLLLSISLLFTGCGGGKYADAKKVSEEYIDITDDYITSLDKANSAEDVVKAINTFSDKMEKLIPKMKKIQEKYPDLNNTDTLPKELVETQKKAEELSQKVAGSMMKMMNYMSDPKVQEAQQHMTNTMMNLQN